jgi:hypothetical protein
MNSRVESWFKVVVEPWPYTDGSSPPSRSTVEMIVTQIVRSVQETTTWPKVINVNYPPLRDLLGTEWTVHQTIKGSKNFFVFELRYQNRSVASSKAKYKEFPPSVVIYA